MGCADLSIELRVTIYISNQTKQENALFVEMMPNSLCCDELERWYFKLHFYNFLADFTDCYKRVRENLNDFALKNTGSFSELSSKVLLPVQVGQA
jgi:hypothetical protein